MNKPVVELLTQPAAGVLFGRCAMGARATVDDRAARIDSAVDEALDNRGGIESEIGDLLSDLLSAHKDDSLFDRWSCSDEHCPGRPGWDEALSETWDEIMSEIDREWGVAARRIIRTRLLRFLDEHPEAKFRTVRAAAA